MSFEIEGKLHKKFDTQNKTETFQAREFVIMTDGQYPQYVKFQLTQDRCALIDPHNEGDQIKVYFDLRGREWNEKYFTNLNAWKVEKAQVAAPNEPPVPTADPFGGLAESSGADMPNEFDDLPF